VIPDIVDTGGVTDVPIGAAEAKAKALACAVVQNQNQTRRAAGRRPLHGRLPADGGLLTKEIGPASSTN
jgi:hypothetical protein